VFINFNLNFDTLATSRAAYDVLRAQSRARLDIEPFLIRRVSALAREVDLRHYFVAQKMDGLTCFRLGLSTPNEPFGTTTRTWHANLDYWIAMSAAQAKHQSTFVPCGSTPFDARPWYMIGWGPWMNPAYATPDARPYNAPASAQDLRAHWSYLKGTLDRFPAMTRRMAILYAWNEWGEGGTIGPSEADGDALLRLVRSVFSPTRGQPSAVPASLTR